MPTNFPTNLDVFINPSETSNMDDPQVLHTTQHSNHNDSITALEKKIGTNFSNVSTSIDFIANLLITTQFNHPNGSYREINGKPFPIQVIWYVDSSKNITLIEKLYIYNTKKCPITITLKLYDGSTQNNLIRTIIDSITYINGVFETSRTRMII